LYMVIRSYFIFSSNMEAPPIRHSLFIKERLSESVMPTFRNPLSPPFVRDCVIISISGQNVMLNLFQHLIKSICYETLKRVQGDKICITTQSPKRGGKGEVLIRGRANKFSKTLFVFSVPQRRGLRKACRPG